MPCAFYAKRPFPYQNLYSGCQFDVPSFELITVNEQAWCPYHCPMVDTHGKPTAKACWSEVELVPFYKQIVARREAAQHSKTVLDFSGVVFLSAVNFQKQQFPSVLFYLASFTRHAWFQKATFNGHAGFEEVTFSGDTSYGRATFSGDTSFSRTTFSNIAWFKGATFNGPAGFHKAIFCGPASFDSSGNIANTFAKMEFSDAFFGSEVSFANRRFLEPVLFDGCIFKKAPDFHGCTFHQGAMFPSRLNFYDVSPGAVQAYQILKLAMEQLNALKETAKFESLVQESRAREAECARLEAERRVEEERLLVCMVDWRNVKATCVRSQQSTGVSGGVPSLGGWGRK